VSPYQPRPIAQSTKRGVSAFSRKTAMVRNCRVIRLHRCPATRTWVSHHTGLVTPEARALMWSVPEDATNRPPQFHRDNGISLPFPALPRNNVSQGSALLYGTSSICQASCNAATGCSVTQQRM
jgi:hypothetical protein